MYDSIFKSMIYCFKTDFTEKYMVYGKIHRVEGNPKKGDFYHSMSFIFNSMIILLTLVE